MLYGRHSSLLTFTISGPSNGQPTLSLCWGFSLGAKVHTTVPSKLECQGLNVSQE